ncbi:LuxR C-terminal-related transcriptional regulator [Cellulomonas sp. NPDC055163]
MSTEQEPPDTRHAAPSARVDDRSPRSAVPLPPAHHVPRERLLALVSRGAGGPLTLVSASAGTGKTTLVSSWVGRGGAPGPVAWLTLDETDRRPTHFWASVVEGLVAAGLDPGPGVPAAPVGDLRRAVLDPVARSLARREEPLVLVLDGGDALSERELGEAMGDLLRDARGRLRLVLLTRTDPFLPLHRYRVDGHVREIRGTDLAFDAAELAELVRGYGLSLSDAGTAMLLERTGGRPIAVAFAAMVLAGRPDAERAVRELRGDGGELAASFVREVLQTQPADLREVLLRTSVVDELRPGLVEALTGLPARGRVLEFMAHGNGFVQPLPGSPGSFRYQALFREFLRAQLAYERPDLLPGLHRRAADWYAEHGRPLEARRHAAAAEAGAQPHPVAPATAPGRTPTGPTGPVQREDEAADGPTVSQRLAVVVLDAHRAYLRSDQPAGLAALALADPLCRRLDPHTLAAHPEIPALLALCRGRLLLLGGDAASARDELVLAERSAQAPGCEELLAAALRARAVLESAAGRLRTGADLLLRADTVAGGVHDGLAPGSAAATVLRAWAGSDSLDTEAARRLGRGAAEAHARHDEVTASLLALVRARLLTSVGTAERPGTSPGDHLPGWLELWLEAASAPARTVAHPVAGRPAPADGGPLTPVAPAAPHRSRDVVVVTPHRGGTGPRDAAVGLDPAATAVLDRQVTTWLAESARAAEQGDLATATAALERSLRLAAPERLRRPFRLAPPAVQRLLRELEDVTARYPWLHGPAPVAPAHAARPTVPTVRRHGARATSATLWEPLTHRETEVLGLLADLLTTEEIAASMYVSVNTVRTHVRSILRKLEVSRRNEAVRRAWELGVLPAGGDTPAPREHAEPAVAAPRVG